jgi:predicted  nucleic acid-binding Zn-ribbon protein
MSQSFKLYRLQQLDTQLDKALGRVQEIDKILNDTAALSMAQLRVDNTAARLESARKNLRSAEHEVQGQHLKIEQTEATLYSGKVGNPKELQDLENEAAALKRYLDVLEERQLETMLAEEEAQNKYETELKNVEELTTKLSVEHGQLMDEKSNLQKDIRRITDERQATVNTIPDDDLKYYQQLRDKRRGIAVAKVTDTFCSACGSTLSTSLLYAARSPNKISCCESCGRILYGG